jgi:hypothetical protein
MAFLVLILLCTPLIHGQDLSKYRKYSLGTSLAKLSKQLGPDSHETNLVQQRPAVIQEIKFWSVSSSGSSEQVDPAAQILFGFYNGALYRIVVTYDEHATAGLTAEDMVQALSVLYGAATRPATEINFPTNYFYGSKEKIIARWEDSDSSVNLFRSSSLDSFGLVVLSKRMDAEAEAAIIESAKLDKDEAPQKEVDRQKKEADDPEVTRQISRKAFRP